MSKDPAYKGSELRMCSTCDRATWQQTWDARAGDRTHNHLGKSLWWAHCNDCGTQHDLVALSSSSN